jgi:hypothetical protein
LIPTVPELTSSPNIPQLRRFLLAKKTSSLLKGHQATALETYFTWTRIRGDFGVSAADLATLMAGQAQHPLQPFSKLLCLNANDGAGLTVLDSGKMTIWSASLVETHD